MAEYIVEAPDGTELVVEGPAGAPEAQVLAEAQRLFEERRKRLLAMPYSEVVEGTEGMPSQEPVRLGTAGQIARGVIKGAVVDPLAAIAQVVGGEETRKQIAEQEAAYQARRAEEGDTGIEVSRIVGSVLSPTGIAAGLGAARALAGAGRAAQAVGAGVAGAVTQPTMGATDTQGFLQEKAEQAGFGAAFGLGGYYVGKALTPQVKEGVDELLRQGIPITPGQAYTGVPGWFFRQIESFDIPTMRVDREAINRQFTRSMGNEVLSSIGGTVPDDARNGIQVFRAVQQQIKNTYDDALSKIPSTDASKLIAGVSDGTTLTTAQLSTTRKAKEFENVIKANIFNKIKDGQISGNDLKTIESFLRKKADSIKAIDSDGDALRTGYNEILKTVKSFIQDADKTGNIAKANEAWMKRARFKSAVEKSVAEVPGEAGTVTPRRMLQEAARQGEGAQAALGTAPLQRQAQQAYDVVGETLEEATKYRNMLIAGKLTGLGLYGLFQPAIAIPLFVASGLSYDVARKLLNSPNFRNALNQAIEKIGPAEVSRVLEQSRMQLNAQE